MENTISGSKKTHQDMYEWWRNKKEEITDSINELREKGSVEPELLDIMEGMLSQAKFRTTFLDYFDENIE